MMYFIRKALIKRKAQVIASFFQLAKTCELFEHKPQVDEILCEFEMKFWYQN